MIRSIRHLLPLMLGILIGTVLTVGTTVLADRSESSLSGHLPLEELRAFSEIFAKVKQNYVEPPEDKELIEGAIRGMLAGLDPHSAYLNTEEFKELQVGTSGEFGGLGIEVTMEDGFVKVVSPIDDTPAERAGVQAGDVVIRLDETPVKGMSLSEAVKMMRGKPGTDIVLTIVREGEQKPLSITITRDVIKVTSVKSRLLDEGFGYIRITNFQTRTAEQIREKLAELKQQSESELRGLVLDLRNNPGGVLTAAVGVSDAFLHRGLIVYTEGREEGSKLQFSAKPGDILNGVPMVVLINGGSASASEIVAGALQDHKRAVIMGDTSFGKGSVQTIYPMSNQSAVKITTARYYTPSGRSIQALGIEPDILVRPLRIEADEAESEQKLDRLSEASLSGHLENGDEKDLKAREQSKEAKIAKETDLARKDFVLHEALTLLRGLQILRNQGHLLPCNSELESC
ncbi:S41 family peptidase [Ectothiorhodospiraceae bacterium BW-2]|nr:S41 family peptidase [Ectothiorhodospiraceae bacterium BW-2]